MKAKPPTPEEHRINRSDWPGEDSVYLQFFKKHNMPIPKKSGSSGTKKKTTKKSSAAKTTKKSSAAKTTKKSSAAKTTKKSSAAKTTKKSSAAKTTKKSSAAKTTKKKTTSKKKISEPQITEKEPQVGDIIKLKSGRIDKIIKVIPEDDWHFKRYMTQELNPPAGQEPKIGKLYYSDFEIIEQNQEKKIIEKTTKKTSKSEIDIYSIQNDNTNTFKVIFIQKNLKDLSAILNKIKPKTIFTSPIIFNVINKKECEILAQNNDVILKTILPCNANKTGTFIIDIKLLNSIVKDLKDKILTLDINEANKITVNNKMSFELLPSDEFNFEFNEITGNKYNNLNFDLFAECVLKMLPFTAKKTSYRKNFHSIHLRHNISNKTLDFVGTDGYILGVTALPINKLPISETQEITLPYETAEIIKLINKYLNDNNNFDLIVEPNQNEIFANRIQINVANIKLITNLIQEKYPNYSAIIPNKKDAVIEFKVNKEKLLSIANECIKLVKDDLNVLDFYFKNNTLKITKVNRVDLTEYSDTIEVTLIKPNKDLNNEFKISVNVDRLNNCLKAFEEPTLSLYGIEYAILITEDGNYTYCILMPVKPY